MNAAHAHPAPTSLGTIVRQSVFLALVAGTLFILAREMFFMLETNGINVLKALIFALFVILQGPIVISFWTAVFGFALRRRERWTLDLLRPEDASSTSNSPLPMTAVVVPVYNEDPVRVFAGIKATYENLLSTGALESFDFFILSDTTDPDTWIREEMAVMDFRKSAGDSSRIFYRNRRENIDRKTGNIAEFCASWGGKYQYMIVFDADSIMAGASLISLVRLMERHPEAGIIQAPPLPVNRRTLFGRMRQFATHAYSGVFLTGLNFWQGGAANYWGHNAIIRIEPFIEHCKLPKLSGPEPLGGSILSHDFVEAAFMRRAGWKVYLATDIIGSYEEVPPSVITYAARDRRWCQGNLQHARLLFLPGLHPVNRIHFALGVMAYVAAPLWLILLLISTVEGILETVAPHHYFPTGHALYPIWKISVQTQAIAMFLAVMGLLMAPKVLSLLDNLRNQKESNAFGGFKKLTLSVLLETVASTLLAPVFAFLQSHFVVGILMGRNIKWEAQDRGDAETSYTEAVTRHWPITVLGLIWAVLLWEGAPRLFWWFSPVIAGFLLAIPISVWSSRVTWGDWARAHGLFLTPEEISPPPVLLTLDKELDWAANRPWGQPDDALARVLNDPEVRATHLTVSRHEEPQDEMRRHYIEGLELKYRRNGSGALTPREKRDLLWDEKAISELLLTAKNT